MAIPTPPVNTKRRFLPWALLLAGLAWTALLRVPLVVNASDHLDSDLAVDGLTLLDFTQGRLRWHYPGTPYMGILPVLSSLPQAMVWGATPATLVSGGVVIWVLVVLGIYWLCRREFGASAASWGLVPLACSSLGTLWLSSRITGGHLFTLAWHAFALVGFSMAARAPGPARALGLGVFCGLGLYIDPMFLFTLFGIAAATLLWNPWRTGSRKRAATLLLAFLGGLALGIAPRIVGTIVDPHDCYGSQFAMVLDRGLILEHVRILGLHCLPRLITGTDLNGVDLLMSRPEVLVGMATRRLPSASAGMPDPTRELIALGLLVLFVMAFVRLAYGRRGKIDARRSPAAFAACVSAILIVPAFLLNRNVYNSDNYRYLVYLLVPWSLGFGLLFSDLASRGGMRLVVALAALSIVIELMTSSVYHWYLDTRGYLSEGLRIVRLDPETWRDYTMIRAPAGRPAPQFGRFYRPQPPAPPPQYSIPSDATHLMGGYWLVYRVAFLSGGKIQGVPYPMYPNRLRGWSKGLAPGEGKLVVFGPLDLNHASGAVPANQPSPSTYQVRSAAGQNWRPALGTLWQAEGRDPAEIPRLSIEVP